MRSTLLETMPVRFLKGTLRRHYRTLRHRYAKWRHPFGRSELHGAIVRAGIARGDAVMLHSAVAAFEGFDGTVSDIIAVFKDAVGPDGTLLIPTLSMQGSAIDYAGQGKVFDPRTTPSKVGMLTEVFRRSPDVVRSIHPTHSVAVWSRDAAWWIEGHHLADTPCGRGTPYFRLLERGGKIVFAGVDIGVMTFYHCVEELLEPLMPQSPFTAERFVLPCKSDAQLVYTAPFRLYDPQLARRRDLHLLENELRKTNKWRESSAGGAHIIALHTRDILSTVEDMARRGAFCYVMK